MLYELIRSGFSTEILISVLLIIPTMLFSLTIHEVSHGFIAYKLGDPTAKSLGRLTLNPLKHLDPIGSLMMLIAGFGWAKPVPVNTRYFKNPRKGMALVALAGPVSNLILGIIGAFLTVIVFKYMSDSVIRETLFNFFYYFLYLNLLLALFNLIPIPPFDGSRIFYVFLPEKVYFGVMKYERIIMIVVLLGFVTGIFSMPVQWLVDLLLKGVCAIFGVRYM